MLNAMISRQLGRALILATVMMAGQALALSPEHETHRLMLATEQAVKEARWSDAGEFLNRLQTLDSEKPDEYLFYRGRVMFESGLLNESRSALENYVKQSGAKGQYYTDALKLITDIEQAQRKAAKNNDVAKSAKPVAVIEPAGTKPVERLEQLYLVDSPVKALRIHLNNLMELNGWRKDQRVIVAGSKPDIGYQVSTEAGRINLQESRRTGAEDSGQFRLTTQMINVYGVNPEVTWECDTGDQSCWIYDPRDGSRLIRLAEHPEGVAEVAKTLGRLIKSLQAPN